MVEGLATILAYVLSFGVPSFILAIGSMTDENKMSTILAAINLIAFLGYYLHNKVIPFWVIGVVFIIISIIFVFMYKAIVGGGTE